MRIPHSDLIRCCCCGGGGVLLVVCDCIEWKEYPFEEPLDIIQKEQLDREQLVRYAGLTGFEHATLRQLHDIFMDISESGVDDGAIDAQELTSSMCLAPSSLLARMMFRLWDVTQSKTIDFTTWVQTLSSLSEHGSLDDKIKFSFQLYDLNGDGTIDKTELRALLVDAIKEYVLDISEEQAHAICDHTLRDVDKDGNGVVEYAEYKEMIRSSAHFLHSFTLDVGDLCRNFRHTQRKFSVAAGSDEAGGGGGGAAGDGAGGADSAANGDSTAAGGSATTAGSGSGATGSAGGSGGMTAADGTPIATPIATKIRAAPTAVSVSGVGRLVLVSEEEAEAKKRAFAAQKKVDLRANSSIQSPSPRIKPSVPTPTNAGGAPTTPNSGKPFVPPPLLKQGSAPVSIGTVQLPATASRPPSLQPIRSPSLKPSVAQINSAAGVMASPRTVQMQPINTTQSLVPLRPDPLSLPPLSLSLTRQDTDPTVAPPTVPASSPAADARSAGGATPQFPMLFAPDDMDEPGGTTTQAAIIASAAAAASATAKSGFASVRSAAPLGAGEETDDFVVLNDMNDLDDNLNLVVSTATTTTPQPQPATTRALTASAAAK